MVHRVRVKDKDQHGPLMHLTKVKIGNRVGQTKAQYGDLAPQIKETNGDLLDQIKDKTGVPVDLIKDQDGVPVVHPQIKAGLHLDLAKGIKDQI